MPKHPTRAAIRAKEVLDRIPDARFGAEIGVLYGEMSGQLLRMAPELHLTMVDIIYPSHPRLYAHIGFAAKRCKIIEGPSTEVAPHIQDASLDFAFIDADHKYEAVMADIAAWLPKIRPGGLLCGHDYGKVPDDVERAVRDSGFKPDLGADWTWFVRI